MKKWMLPFALLGVVALGAQGCEVQEGGGSDTTNPTDTLQPDAGGDTTQPMDTVQPTTAYYAVFLEDRSFGWIIPGTGNPNNCSRSSIGAHGADIDAVALWDGNDLVGYLDTVDAWHDDRCSSYGRDDTSQVLGAPNGTLTQNFYSLSFGWLIGEFDGQAEILPGYEMTVYEIDDDFCTVANCIGSEPYSIYVATDLDCVNMGSSVDNAKSLCMVLISDTAEGSVTVPLSGF